jgi:hypothetical protein
MGGVGTIVELTGDICVIEAPLDQTKINYDSLSQNIKMGKMMVMPSDSSKN